MKKVLEKIRGFVSLPALIMFTVSLLCAVIHIISVNNASFSDAFSSGPAAFFRALFAKITGWLPFSLAEIIIVLSPVALVAVVVKAIRLVRADGKRRIRFLCSVLAVLSFVYSSFVLTFATSYRGSPLEDKLGLDRQDVGASELAYALDKVIAELSALDGKTEYSEDGFSVMPYDFSELGRRLSATYAVFSEENSFISALSSTPKRILLSEPMTYTHISGVYSFFTGEANVNVNYPEFVHPFTAAHEMAHQRGVAREDEANFVAFLVCISSEDDYIRYSGYLNMFEYLSNALYRADRELYKEKMAVTPLNVLRELVAYSDFFDKYRDSAASKVSDKVNNGYLISQGQTSGTKSYGLVVDLCVAYYEAEDKGK